MAQELDDSWTDESIDHLLAQADASGDGELQVEAPWPLHPKITALLAS